MIENIITSQDDIYRSDLATQQFVSVQAKEVHLYAAALRDGFERVQETGLLLADDILRVQGRLEENKAGFGSCWGLNCEMSGVVKSFIRPHYIPMRLWL